jgi:hypothetical protein
LKKPTHQKGVGEVAQVLSKGEALSLNPNAAPKKENVPLKYYVLI